MRGQQHEPKPLVDHREVTRVGHDPLRLLLQVRVDDQQRRGPCLDGLRSETVQGPPPGGREQPRGAVGGDAVTWPRPRGRLEGIREGILGQVETAVPRDEQGQESTPFLAVGPRQLVRGQGHRTALT